MQITGSYMNYLNVANLLSPFGVKSSGDLTLQVFSSSVENLQGKIDKQIFSSESNEALTKLYSEVSDLATKASSLTMTDINSVFYDRTPKTSDSSVLTATAWDAFSQDSGAEEAIYNISVTQLGQAQENTGLALNKVDSSSVDPGTDSFHINVDGQDYGLSIEVLEGDTNEVVLQKIEIAINDAALGMTADIIDNSADGTQQLVIRADATGATNAFTISDVSGNAIGATGTDSITIQAQDATYSFYVSIPL